MIAGVEIVGAGFGLHWPARDADVTLRGLMNGVFGTRAWMSELARRAGRTTSPAKAAAARANGAKGGRLRRAGVSWRGRAPNWPWNSLKAVRLQNGFD